jgi:hypothetical protein
MEPAHVVLLLAVAIAVVAIAGYLIAITLILKHVVNRLVTILGAVEAVTETAQPVGAVIDEINRDLDAGRKLIENGVERLAESREPVGATAGASSRHPTSESSLTEPDSLDHDMAVPHEHSRMTYRPSQEPPLIPGDASSSTSRDAPNAPTGAPDGGTSAAEDVPGGPPRGRGRGWWNR